MSSKSLGRATAVMAAGTLVSRILGLVRSFMLAAAMGLTGSVAIEAYSVANRLPNVMFAVLSAGVLNSALVPQIVKAFKDGRERTVHRILTIAAAGIGALTLILTITAAFWVRVYSSGWTSEQTALATAFALWCIPQLLFYGLYTLFGQVLNAREQYGWFMWSPALANVVAIAGLGAYLVIFGANVVAPGSSVAELVDEWTPLGIFLVAGAATLGIAAQALILIGPMVKGGYRWRPVWRGPKGELTTASRVAMWALGGVLIEQLVVLAVTNVNTAASAVSKTDPSVAGSGAYDTALMIVLVPHSLVSISLMTALFIRMAKQAADHDIPRVRETMSDGVRLVGAFTLFATAAGAVLAPHIVRVLTPANVTGESVRAVAWVVGVMAFALVPLGASVMIKQAYFALEDVRPVFLFHIPMAIAWLAVAFTVRAVAEPHWWVPGTAAGFAATNVVAAVLRLWGLRKRLGGADGRRIVTMHARAGVAALAAAAVGGALVWVLPATWEDAGIRATVGSASIAVGVACVMAIVYLGLARVLKIEEVTGVVRTVTRRLGRVR